MTLKPCPDCGTQIHNHMLKWHQDKQCLKRKDSNGLLLVPEYEGTCEQEKGNAEDTQKLVLEEASTDVQRENEDSTREEASTIKRAEEINEKEEGAKEEVGTVSNEQDKREEVSIEVVQQIEETEDDLDTLEAQLRASLIEIERKREIQRKFKEEQERKKLEERDTVIHVKRVFISGGAHIEVTNYPPRADVKALLDSIRYSGGVSQWLLKPEHFISLLKQYPEHKNVTLKYDSDKVEREVDYYINPIPFFVQKTQKEFLVRLGPTEPYNPLYSLNAQADTTTTNQYKIPLGDGWRIWDKLKKQEGVVYTEDAKAFIEQQVERRVMLDSIGSMEDYPEFSVKLHDGMERMFKPFQKVGHKFIDLTGGKAIIAYDMGLGKSLIALSYHAKKKETKPDFRTLIVCQGNLKPNLSREVKKWLGVQPFTITGSVPTEFDMKKLLLEKPEICIINYDIIRTTVKIDNSYTDENGARHVDITERYLWVDLLNMSQFDYIIVDEGHYIKNVEANQSIAVRRLIAPNIVFLTGTPILNRPGELWPMLHMIDPNTFPMYETFLRQYTYDGKQVRNVDQLREILRTVMIRRTKKDVMKDLPPINRIDQFYTLNDREQLVYDRILEGVYETINTYYPNGVMSERQNITSVLVQIMRLKQVCAIAAVPQSVDLAQNVVDSGEGQEHNKVILFTQFHGTAYAMKQALGNDALCFIRRSRKGYEALSATERDDMVQQFQTDPYYKYLVVTEKTAREGHNITAAGTVIFNDLFWTPASHQQCEGRAYGRMNDPHPITSYYLVAEDTVSEWIKKLLAEKLAIIEEVIEGTEASRDQSIVNELINMMRESKWTIKKPRG